MDNSAHSYAMSRPMSPLELEEIDRRLRYAASIWFKDGDIALLDRLLCWSESQMTYVRATQQQAAANAADILYTTD